MKKFLDQDFSGDSLSQFKCEVSTINQLPVSHFLFFYYLNKRQS